VNRAPLSAAAALLLRSLLLRSGLGQDRIFLSKFRSVDWQSLTFTGERHEIGLRLLGPGAEDALDRLRDGLGDAEWELNGHVVADILIVATHASGDGSIDLDLEALTLSD
jgi:hypothetical protein